MSKESEIKALIDRTKSLLNKEARLKIKMEPRSESSNVTTLMEEDDDESTIDDDDKEESENVSSARRTTISAPPVQSRLVVKPQHRS
jgi:hypothetical protein